MTKSKSFLNRVEVIRNNLIKIRTSLEEVNSESLKRLGNRRVYVAVLALAIV